MSDPVRISSNEKNEKGEYVHDDNLSSTVARTTSDGHHSPNEKGKPTQHVQVDEKTRQLQLVNAKLANPLMGKSKAEIIADVNEWTKEHGMGDLVETFRKGALVAANPTGFEEIDELDEEDKNILRCETTHKWSQPKELYYMVAMCSLAAAVQGMDETVINGANLFWPAQFGINTKDPDPSKASRDQWLLGIVASAPYLCCALIGCWLTDPLNRRLGRRGTIFVTGLFSALTCFWSGLTNNWYHLFIARFFLGLGIGPKSTTVPVYTAECAPPNIRGALVMQWQTWTAFGIFIPHLYVSDIRLQCGVRCRLGTLPCPRPEWHHWPQLETHARLCGYTSHLRLHKHLLLPRVPTLAHSSGKAVSPKDTSRLQD